MLNCFEVFNNKINQKFNQSNFTSEFFDVLKKWPKLNGTLLYWKFDLSTCQFLAIRFQIRYAKSQNRPSHIVLSHATCPMDEFGFNITNLELYVMLWFALLITSICIPLHTNENLLEFCEYLRTCTPTHQQYVCMHYIRLKCFVAIKHWNIFRNIRQCHLVCKSCLYLIFCAFLSFSSISNTNVWHKHAQYNFRRWKFQEFVK